MSTRDKLLSAAESLFVQKGYTATTVDQICAAAGTTKGAFFHHFKGKEEMALVTIDRFTERTLQHLQQLSRLDALLEALSKTLHTPQTPSCLIAMMTVEMAQQNAQFQTRAERF